ncbi:Protein phosphatase 1K [Nibea albiflora]|uniref:Protein phosphatase 1K n=1 Tax=Nibea albiflora TaxID=240163 RepID=A0ACB7EYS2_NIBAL|nr:Protein phosphatase 1K [Nibea albiflora]
MLRVVPVYCLFFPRSDVHRRDTISNSSSFSAIVGTRMSVSPAWYLNVGDTIEINCTAHSDKNNKTDKLDLQLVWTKMGDGTKKVLASQQANQRISYVLGPVTHEHSGVYTCGVDRSLPNVYFHDWHSLIWVQDTSSPRASIDVTSHNRSQFFSGENFTVSCQLPEDDSQWKMMSYTVFLCTVAVTVVLESPPLPVLEGEDVMLRCLHRNRTTKQIISNFRTFFYKNRKRIGSMGHCLGWWVYDGPAGQSTLTVTAAVGRLPGTHLVSLSRVGSASILGLRKQNEDRLRVARIHDNLLYFAVFDGHGGPHAADYCYTFMEKHIRDALEEDDDLEKVLKKAFLDADKALHTHLSYFNNASFLTAGTTATVAMLRDGVELVVGSVGDSRAMLCRKGQANKLTKDHTPDRKDERQRIQRFGGFVTWNSVGQANVNGRLAMTRSIGDFHLKTSGVIAEPDTRRVTVQHANDLFLALTTDGINFLLSDQEICDVINQCPDPTEAADVISQQALQYGSEDNATIVIVPFGAWGKHQSSTAIYSMSRNFASSGRWA